MASPNTVLRQGWGRTTLLPGDKVVFEGYGGKVVETMARWRESRRATTPNTPLFIQGGPEAAREKFPGQ